MSWKRLEEESPGLAAFGKTRFATKVAFLGTLRKDGSPRVHPVTPIIDEERLLIFMEPTSPKGYDLNHRALYALHGSVEDSEGGSGEFLVSGTARLVEEPAVRESAEKHAGYEPKSHYILFELEVTEAFSTVYSKDGTPVRERWVAQQ